MTFPSVLHSAPLSLPQINYQHAQVPAEWSISQGTMKKLLIGFQELQPLANGDCSVTTGRSRPPGHPHTHPASLPSSSWGTRAPAGQPGPAGPPADVTSSVWAWREAPCPQHPDCSPSARQARPTHTTPNPRLTPPGSPSGVKMAPLL